MKLSFVALTLTLSACGRLGFEGSGDGGPVVGDGAFDATGASGDGSTVDSPPFEGPTFVAANSIEAGAAFTLSNTVTGSLLAGDTVVVFVGWNGGTGTVTMILDSLVTTYTVASPYSRTTNLSQVVYAGRMGLSVGSLNVNVGFSASFLNASLRVVVVRGVDVNGPAGSGYNTSSATTICEATTPTLAPNTFLLGGNLATVPATGVAAGQIVEHTTSPGGHIVFSLPASTPADYSPQVQLSGTGECVLQIVHLPL